MFLDELPEDGTEWVDLSASGAGSTKALDAWRSTTTTASQGWYDTGFAGKAKAASSDDATPRGGYEVGMRVAHDAYGVGRVTAIQGHGALRKLKVRFASGERTFIADKAKLLVVQGAV
jgi:DNA helicase-2/ATP-dependent DNA helicase PcrA